MRDGRRHLRMPLSFLVGRYFLYVLLGGLLFAGLPLVIFSASMESGTILPANYGELNGESVRQELAAQEVFDPSGICSAFWYAHVSATGEVLETDMTENWLSEARNMLAANASTAFIYDTAGTPTSFTAFQLGDGSWCVLANQIQPQWADRTMRDTWMNPQTLCTGFICISLLAVLILTALRASHVLTRKMAPLVDAARSVGSRNLDFATGTSNVAQIDDVLDAMEQMRVSLKSSLEQQWASEQRQRQQIAALTHDLKTPLTVIRGNADLLVEDAKAGKLPEEQASCALAISTAALQADARVVQIIAASSGQEGASTREPVDVAAFMQRMGQAALQLASAKGVAFNMEQTDRCRAAVANVEQGRSARPLWDADALLRAVLNLVGNACDFAAHTVRLTVDHKNSQPEGSVFTILVEDDGPGLHADAARCEDGESHFGLGLSIAQRVARDHGGSLEVTDIVAADGGVRGAKSTIIIPDQ